MEKRHFLAALVSFILLGGLIYAVDINGSLNTAIFDSITSNYFGGSYYIEAGNASDIQAKINLAAANGGCVMIPYGFYNLTSIGQISVYNDTCLIGVGNPIFYSTNTTYMISLATANNVTIKGIIFKSDYTQGVGGITATSSDNLRIEGCKFYDINGTAINTIGGINPTIEYNFINHTNYGIVFRNYYGRVRFNEIWYAYVDGIYGVSSNGYMDVSYNQVYNSITRNGISDDYGNHVTFNGNILVNNSWYGLYTEVGRDFFASGNQIIGSGRSGILFKGRSTVEGNFLSDNVQGGIYVTHTDDSRSGTCNQSIIKGNVILNSGRTGIYLRNCSFSDIEGNTIFNYSTSSEGDYYGIELWEAPVEYNLIKGNIITDIGTTPSIGLYSAETTNANNRWEDNVIIGNRPYLLTGKNETLKVPYQANDEGLVAYLNFEEGSGNIAYDSSGNARNGTNTNLTYVNGRFGKAGYFNYTGGINTKINMGDDPQYTTVNQTITAWIKLNEIDRTQSIASKYRGGEGLRDFSFYVASTNTLKYYVHNNTDSATQTSVTQFVSGRWYFVAGRFTGASAAGVNDGTLTIFVDNIEKYTLRHNVTHINDGSVALYIGSMESTQYFNGTIDEVKIYNRSLTDEEIMAQYYMGVTIQGNGYLEAQKDRIDNLTSLLDAGLTGNATIRNSTDTENCTMTFIKGLLTATTCTWS